jgi:curved DNA-binding protein CbpA
MNSSTPGDPFAVLGLPLQASEAEIRARYLELVKQYPPERDPDKFREVQAAFEAAKDPLLIAERLLEFPDTEAPPWLDAIEVQKQNPPKLTPELLVSLGNRDQSAAEQSNAAPPESNSHNTRKDDG